jgi:hypothetical protein
MQKEFNDTEHNGGQFDQNRAAAGLVTSNFSSSEQNDADVVATAGAIKVPSQVGAQDAAFLDMYGTQAASDYPAYRGNGYDYDNDWQETQGLCLCISCA